MLERTLFGTLNFNSFECLISNPFGDKTGCILVINALKEIIISIN